MGACIFPEEEYETCTCYFCKACHRKRFGYSKRSEKWDNTSCLTCGDMLPEKCNWINVVIKGEVCNQTSIALINGAIQEDVCQMKEAEYIEYIMKLAKFDYEDKVETYHQIVSHTYPTQEA
ncbi:hypothetical protein G9A89_007545 [Geosiphon pyriformis]|nr:hypothetical protein G9A89_007545 [Geosiphon pyriformis]